MARALLVEHAAAEGAGSLARWLPAAGLELDVVRPWRGDQRPTSTARWDALVVLGGFESANDDDPGLREEEALLRSAVEAGLPTLGICLGMQLLATALGGEVRRAAAGEHGAASVRLTASAAGDPVLGGRPVGQPLGVLQSHDDEVTALPPGAELLATGDGCRVQAFRVGSALGLQFHPEADATLVAGWAVAAGRDPAADVAGLDAVDLEGTWRPSLARFATVARAPHPLVNG